MGNQYLYYAFISHKSEDDAYAEWLWKKLRHYRIPAALSNQCSSRLAHSAHGIVPRKVDQLFLDFKNMPSGQTREKLDYSLARSQYLIVICSRHTAQEPEWIDHEIRSFMANGHDPADIFALVVDPTCEDPVAQCFPPELKKLNIKASCFRESKKSCPSMGKRHQAFLGILAGILGVNKDEVERIDKQQKMSIGVAVLLACVLCGTYLYHRFFPHYSYFRDYILVNNVAQGIYPLDKNALAEQTHYYKFTRVNDILQSVEHRNYADFLFNQDPTVLNEGAARIEYTYLKNDDSGMPETASYYNYKDQLIVRYQFFEKGTRVSRVCGEKDSAVPCCVPVNLEESSSPLTFDRTNISKYKQVFDEEGRLVKRLFAQGDRYEPANTHSSLNMYTESQNLIYGYAFDYNAQGRVSMVSYLGTPEGDRNGVIGKVHAVEYLYDPDTGRLVQTTNLDVYHQPVENAAGWVSKRIILDSGGNPSLEEYLDASGKRKCLEAGYAAKQYQFDGVRRIGYTYLDADGMPVAVDGYVSVVYVLDHNGVITEAHYLDENGNPALCSSEGGYGWKNTYGPANDGVDEYANYSRILLDKDLVSPKKGAMTSKMEEYYTENEIGKKIYVIKHTYGFAETSYCRYSEYDSKTFQYLREYYCDEEGKLADIGMGFAERTAEYDVLGLLSALIRYNNDGREIARFDYTYEKRTSLHSVGKSAETERLGAASSRLIQDGLGRVVEIQYLDETGELMMTTDGYAAKRYTYDEQTGRMDSITKIGTNGLPVIAGGHAMVQYRFNTEGEILSVAYFDNLYSPMINPSQGYASWERGYNDRGMLLFSQFNGTDGPIYMEEFGYARVEYTFDEQDNITSVQYYGSNGTELCFMNHEKTGYSRVEQIFDENGICTGRTVFVTDGANLYPVQ